MKKIIIAGYGNMGRELAQYIHESGNILNMTLLGFIDDTPEKQNDPQTLGPISTHTPIPDAEYLISIAEPAGRAAVAKHLTQLDVPFTQFIHPTAYVAQSASIGPGCIITPQCFIAHQANLGEHVLMAAHAGIGHDAQIGNYCVFSPYSMSNGTTKLAEQVFLGSHAVIFPDLNVGVGSKISAQSVAIKDVPDHSLVQGNPGRAWPLPKR